MAKVQTVLTGVAGSPYYMNGYFDLTVGTAQDMIDAWHTFVVGAIGSDTSNYPTGALIRTDGTLQVVNPVDGAVEALVTGAPQTSGGIGTGPVLPPSNQALVRWRTGIYVDRREVRGRTNIPAQFEAASTVLGQVEPAYINGYTDRGQTLIDDENTNFVVWSKKNGQWQPAVTASCWEQFAILRSRRD